MKVPFSSHIALWSFYSRLQYGTKNILLLFYIYTLQVYWHTIYFKRPALQIQNIYCKQAFKITIVF